MPAGWDQSKFDAAMVEYARYSKRTIQQIINTKAWYIARKAIWFTHKADPNRIKAQLGQAITVNALNKNGKTVKKRVLTLVKSQQKNAPLAALIVNARRGAAGKKGLSGKKMVRAITQMLSARVRSVAFTKSGWLTAVRKLEPLADRRGKPPIDTAAKRIGRDKGDAKPSGLMWNAVAQIMNLASAKRDKNNTLQTMGARGLAKAFSDETASMNKYVEDKMKADAARFNQKAA